MPQDADRPPPALPLPRVRRRCLGPKEVEHYFFSAHAGERICPVCRNRQRNLNLSAQEAVPAAHPPEEV